MTPEQIHEAAIRLAHVRLLVNHEVGRAIAKFPAYNSSHEGVSVIREEFDELWDEVKNNKVEGSKVRQMQEAIQVAATAIRFVFDLSSGEDIINELMRRELR